MKVDAEAAGMDVGRLARVDPADDLVVVFMTQVMPSGTFNCNGQLKALVYPAIAD